MSIAACTSFLSAILLFLVFPSSIHSHGGGIHPIAKLIRGTFASYDDNGDEAVRMYICKAGGGRFHGTFIQNSDNSENYMTGFATFTTANIDNHANTITQIEAFFQHKGHAQEITPASMDVARLCDYKELTVSFTFQEKEMSMDFVKISVKDELLGNDDLNGYQCGIPWDGDFSQEDVYPLAFQSDPFSWSPVEQWSELELFTEDEAGCWSYFLPDGTNPGTGFGDFFQRRVYANGAFWSVQWNDQTLQSHEPCSSGSELSVRVDKDVLLTGFQCRDGAGAGFLLYKVSSVWTECPLLA